MRKPRLLVLVSGYGRLLEFLCQSCEVRMVYSQNAKTTWVCHRCKVPLTISENDDLIFPLAKTVKADLVFLAGWNRLLKVPKTFEDRVLNSHPSLLPDFGGKGMYGDRVHQAVLETKESMTGCTVHLVDDEYDHGRILSQRRCNVATDDTVETLGDRVRDLERQLVIETIDRYWKELNGK